jgi:hypothetical protein
MTRYRRIREPVLTELQADVVALEEEGGGVTIPEGSLLPLVISGEITRADTAGAEIGTLPAHAIPLATMVAFETPSDGTSPTVRVGRAGADDCYVPAFGVDASNLGGNLMVYGLELGIDVGASPVPVIATYEETGAPSAEGGPFGISLIYVQGAA